MKKTSSLILLSLFVLTAYAQTVTIGTQVWMSKNLDVSTFRNGDAIPEAKTPLEWSRAARYQEPAWCYYENNATNKTKYGKMYNWYAVNDPRGLAPSGYHIASDSEWDVLTNLLRGVAEGFGSLAGKKMKSTTGWDLYVGPKGNGTNSSGFCGLPGGYRTNQGEFFDIGINGIWWSSTQDEYSPSKAGELFLSSVDVGVTSNSEDKGYGFSVRCIKD